MIMRKGIFNLVHAFSARCHAISFLFFNDWDCAATRGPQIKPFPHKRRTSRWGFWRTIWIAQQADTRLPLKPLATT